MMMVLLLLACRDPTQSLADTADTAPPPADSGAADTVDASASIRFLLSAPLSGAVVTLEQYDPVTTELQGAYAAAPIDGSEVTLALPESAPTQMYWLDDEGYPDAGVAIFHPMVHDDLDGDGAHSAGEPYLGVGAHRPLYIEIGSTMPPDWAALGLLPGWNVLREKELLLDPDLVDPQRVPLDLSFTPVETLSLAGAGGEGLADVSMAMLPYQTLSGEASDPALHTAPWTDEAWSIDLVGAPDASAFYPWVDGYDYVLAMPILFVDGDGSGDVSEGDALAGPACVGGLAAGALWLPPPTDTVLAASLAVQGIPAGWSPIVIDGDRVALTESSVDLRFDGSCAL